MSRLCALPVLLLLGIGIPLAAAEAVGFPERFALAEDREGALAELVPGSEEHFYYRALLLQQRRELAAVDALLDAWRERHRHTGDLRRRIEFRQILLRYQADPAESLRALARELGLGFHHQPQRPGDGADHPSVLDQEAIAWSAYLDRVHAHRPSGLTDHGLWRYASQRAADRHRRETLQRIRWPDHPKLIELVLADLRDRHSPGFGSLPIHARLTRSQLDALRGRLPDLASDQAFVAAYLRTLRPDAAVDLQRDRAARVAWLDRAWAFAAELPPVHNSLKVHLLYHRLDLDRAMGVFDHTRFLTYLQLPRQADYVEPAFLRRVGGDARARLDRSYDATALPPVHSDEELVRSYLLHYLRDAASPAAYDDYLRDTWLERVFVEAKVTAGVGDAERWFARLEDPGFFQHLRDRVDIDIAPTNPEYLAVDDAVRLAVDVKNVERLLVRIYEIDAGNVYRETGGELGVALDLDGLVANHHRVMEFDAPPLRRTRREIALDEIAGPGTWIVELIGNGRSSRALIRKGRLVLHQQITAAGHRCRILDAAGEPHPEATLWLAGHRYRPDEDGAITLPFTTEPGTQAVILEEGPLASLDHFHHHAEHYQLDAALHVDREQLLAGAEAEVVVRARLSLHGRPVPIGFVLDERLRITAVDRTGTETAIDVGGFELVPGEDAVARFRVPEGLRRIDLRLEGRVELASGGEDQAVAVTRSLAVNGVADSVQVAQCHLAPTAGGWVLERRDRNGDPVPGVAVSLGLRHRDFTAPYHVTLETDARGRIGLGALADIVEVTASVSGDPTGSRSWSLEPGQVPLPHALHGLAGEPLRLSHDGAEGDPRRANLALFELRGDAPAADRFDALHLEGGWLELRGLEPGDYRLVFRQRDHAITVRVDRGPVRAGALHAAARRLELAPGDPVAVRSVTVDDEALVIALAGHDAATRVHVFADRYLPAFDHVAGLALPPWAPGTHALYHPGNEQVSGRRIGDEYRYILDRRRAERHPGNMLPRPGLLLNPWAINQTQTEEAQGGDASGAFGGRGGEGRKASVGRFGGSRAEQAPVDAQADLDFLAAPAPALIGLRPGGDGVVRVPRGALGQAQHVVVVAVAPGATAARRILLPEQDLATRDLRLLDGFDPASHVSRQQLTSVLAAGDSLELADIAR